MNKLSCAPCREPCPLGDLSPHEMWALNGLMRSVSFLPKQAIFEQGDPQRGCYLICDGVAVLFNRAFDGHQLVVGVVGPGDIVGVGSFLGQERHELSAYALTEVRAQHLSQAACERLVQEPSELTGRMLIVLARQVKSLRRYSRYVAARAGVRERLAALLVELGGRFGQRHSSGGLGIELKLSCELLGAMLGAHRTTVNEELCELRRRGLIAREAGRIVILDEAGLRQLAESVF